MADDNNQGGMPGADNGTFEAWLDSQPDEIKNRVNEGTQGLRNALNTERENAKSLSKQIKELQASAEKGSELEKKLTEMQEKLAESEKRDAFMDGAKAAGCANAKAAWKLAKADPDLWKRDGSPDWEEIKKTAPEFFDKKQPAGNAGSGTKGDDPNAGKSNYMDDWIRKSVRH